ncbi:MULTISPECIES: hypothetical protein [Flagellimonas]|uniref:Uncharacterized protein n=1 Tax=Flagellimonas hadalis TaxID=2597517 RepID=A0A5N5IZA5_9FLAO|nr:hypothetical protein [Allomuricauda hadalis]KAB5492157.1 hypothetical protein FOT42_004190 [Allomuricauda hadalis]
MSKAGINAIVILLAILFGSCRQNTFDTEAELLSYVKDMDNGYYYERQIGNVVYTLTFRPTDVLVQQAIGDIYSEEEVDSLREKYGDYLYFNLGMSANGQELLNSMAGDRTAFGSMVDQLVFGMAERVHLISQKRDTIPMADYIYPRIYGMSNNTNILLVYPKDKELLNGDYIHFTIEDLGFHTGEVGFKISSKKLKEQPKLNFKNTL